VRFASLGSGSQGNGLVVCLPGRAPPGVPTRFVLIDCGFNRREAVRRLALLGLSLEGLVAVLVTHEHSDHITGVFRVADAASAPVYLTHGTMMAARDVGGFDASRCRILVPDRPVAVGDLSLLPFAVPHDAREPVQYVIDDGHGRLGLLTDVGRSTPHLIERLGGVQTLVLECNHDRALLANGGYPPSLKRRVGGDFGHLANDAAARILAAIDQRRLRRVVAAHLSQQNNRPELARAALAAVLGCVPDDVAVADQAQGFAWQTA